MPGTHLVDEVCVGDPVVEPTRSAPEEAGVEVYLLAGQSNMDGRARSTGLPPSWLVADPSIPMWSSDRAAFVPLQPASSNGVSFMGPDVSFGHTMLGAGRSVRIIRHAVGATNLALYWRPGEAGKPGGVGWNALLDVIAESTAALTAEGRPWRWAGLAWMQGESDATKVEMAAAYEENLTHFLRRVREETERPDLPVALGLVACDTACPAIDVVRAAQAKVAATVPGVIPVETLDLPREDGLHLDGPSMRVFGARLADAFLGRAPSPAPVPALAVTEWTIEPHSNGTIGWRFTTSAPIIVTDIGVLGTKDNRYSEELGIWDINGALLLRGTVPGWFHRPTSQRDGFRYTAIEPLSLPPGDYVVGVVSYAWDATEVARHGVGATGPGLAYVESRSGAAGWLSFPTQTAAAQGFSLLGPNFLYTK